MRMAWAALRERLFRSIVPTRGNILGSIKLKRPIALLASGQCVESGRDQVVTNLVLTHSINSEKGRTDERVSSTYYLAARWIPRGVCPDVGRLTNGQAEILSILPYTS